MSLSHRLSQSWSNAVRTRWIDARARRLSRAASGLVALVGLLALGSGLIVAGRLNPLVRGTIPALEEARRLDATLTSLGSLLASAGTDATVAQLGRADSLAEAFHLIARAAEGTKGHSSTDVRFSGYYRLARQATQGPGAGPDTENSIAAAAAASFQTLHSQLSADIAARERAVADGAASAQAMQSLALAIVAIVSALAITAVILLGGATTRSIADRVEHTASLVNRIVDGDFSVTLLGATDSAEGELQQALRTLVQTLRDHTEAADALAAGAFRRVLPPRVKTDPVGLALVTVARYMDETAAVARRIARGDLGGPAPLPAVNDTFAQANAAMTRHIVSLMREMEVMKLAITATAEQMRAEADELVAGTSDDAERLRHAADRIAQMTLQAHAGASRAVTLEERSMESAAIVRDGAMALDGSIARLKEACHRTTVVQDLARSTGLLVISAISSAAQGDAAQAAVAAVEDDVRRLATMASATALEVDRLNRAGMSAAGESQLILERMGDSIHESRYLVRELTATSRSHAAELLVVDETMSEAHKTARYNAAMARRLAARVEHLSVQARRLDALLRRFQHDDAAAPGAQPWPKAGPVLYRTPGVAGAALPRLAIVGK